MNYRPLPVLMFILLFNTITSAQDNPHIGLMLNLTNTTIRVPNGTIFVSSGPGGGIGEGSDNTGYETNFGVGIYATVPINYTQNIGFELFYDKTTSKQFEALYFSAINIDAFIDYDPFDINLYLSVGVGTGIILDAPEFEDTSLETKKLDLFAKAAIAYKFDGIGRIELGGYPGVKSVVTDRFTRGKYYLGIKLPIDEYFD